ncbi:AtpZ/AtpI family protein [Flammeovirgaceae bacterium SG7u.111]|nr:AtpZ/AtpI family protein [Flammeovirgaceae bacterium SG7u.132]WPO34286.1 AtpZ/AtpI family protein [Flammeovirgaceae bacterium SG7u.111]
MDKPKHQSTEKQSKNQRQNPKPLLSDYAKYSGIATKMALTMVAGVLGGMKIDEWLELETPIFTIILALLSSGLAIYIIIKDT